MASFTAKLAVIAIAAAGVIAGAAPGSAAEPKLRFAFSTPPTTLALPYYVAQKKGWLDGLQVEEIYVAGDANAMRSLLSGNADAAMVGTLNVLSAIDKGGKVKVIDSWQPLSDYNLVLAAGKGSTLKDLVGKTFAASGPGGLPEELPRLIMKKHDVSTAGARFLQVGGHSARLQAVLAGRTDAALVNTVTALRGVGSGQVKIVARSAREFPALGYIYNVVREESLSDPTLSKQYAALVAGDIRGARFIMENPDEAAAILHERLPDLSLDYLKTVVRDLNEDKVWGVDGGIDPDFVKATVALYHRLGKLKTEIPVDRIVDRRYVEKALAKSGSK